MTRPNRTLLLAAATAATLAACDTGKVAPAPPLAAAQGVAVRVDPASITVARGASAQLAATVTGTPVDTVTWSVLEPGDAGTVSRAGLYRAPAAASGTFHVRARSDADAEVFADAAVTVAPPCTSFTYSAWGTCSAGTQARTVLASLPSGCLGGASPVLAQSCAASPVTVTVSPRAATLDACGVTTLAASVANASDRSVRWTVQEPGGGAVSGGVYTAPAVAGTYHVVAASVLDPTAVDTATLTVGADRVLSVAVSPAVASLAPGASQQFTATIRTGCGTFTSSTVLAAQ